MTRRGWLRSKLLVSALLIVVAVAVVVVGRIESNRAVNAQLDGIARVRGAALATGKRPDAYRLTPTLDCLLYGVGPNPYALELCYDHSGGLVEAIDRRRSTHVFWDIEYSPADARIAISPLRLSDTLRAMGAFKHMAQPPGGLPTYVEDFGPQLRGVAYPAPQG